MGRRVSLQPLPIPESRIRPIAVSLSPDHRFPRSARLLKNADFQFSDRKRVFTDFFVIAFSLSGRGRLGVSLPKKILRHAHARNRVRRLIRETFRRRREEFLHLDVHIIARPALAAAWSSLQQEDVEVRFDALAAELGRERCQGKSVPNSFPI